jgi:AhpC/TSA family protein
VSTAETWNVDTHVRLSLAHPQLCYYPPVTLRTAFKLVGSVAVGLLSAMTGAGRGHSAELKVGDPAPPFNLPGSDERTHRLADYRGKSAVVLAWFPKAFTGG